MGANKNIRQRDREIRDVVRHLSTVRQHTPAYIRQFIRDHYFVSDYYQILYRVDDQPVDYEICSLTYKSVFEGSYI
jgi:hypothetical protein